MIIHELPECNGRKANAEDLQHFYKRSEYFQTHFIQNEIQRILSVMRARRQSTIEMMPKRAVTFDSGQPSNSKW